MKKLHLVCNAHLDPVWMWDWHEGAAEALATYYSAVQLSKEYDYIFCHNEVILYEYIEKYAPLLFEEIKELVKAGKWHIMGGWYLQPDCMLPAGETFIRQVTIGREYFSEKFNVEPKVAINFDSFGHTRGLPQILKKCGYEGYLFCRPMPQLFQLPDEPFYWEGYDGSKVKALRVNDINLYCSALGNAKEEILRKVGVFEKQETGLALWGVGNHGGGASRKDLSDILVLKDEKKGEYEVIHSTPEAYFAEVTPTKKVSTPLPCFIKSYSSISIIKQKQIELENALYTAERACAAASLAGVYTPNKEAFHEAERMLCAMGFHDVLSGTCAIDGMQSTVRKAEHAIELVYEEFLTAFHALAKSYGDAKDKENPFVIFNYQPYAYETVVETEILIPTAIDVSMDTQYTIHVYQDGKEIPSQVIKELSNINYDRRKRIAYKPMLNPLGVSRVDLYYEVTPKTPKFLDNGEEDIVLTDAVKTVRISHKTGLLESMVVGGEEYLSGGAFAPYMFDDNADPWGWDMYKLGKNLKPFKLETEGKGPFKGLRAVRIIEKGDVLTEVESIFTKGSSYVRLSYKIYKDLPYVDVTANVLWNEQQKGLKLKVPAFVGGKYFAGVAYGTEKYKKDGGENVGQKFVGVANGADCLAVYTNCQYSNSMQNENMYLTLLNGSAYCAHPIGTHPLVDDTRFISYIEQGSHTFTFRIAVNKVVECEKMGQEFNSKPYSVNMYPHGDGNIVKNIVTVDNPNVVLSALKARKYGGYIVRLFNNSNAQAVCAVQIKGVEKEISFKKYEFKTFVFDGKTLKESKRADLY